jgi:hypothetical protein
MWIDARSTHGNIIARGYKSIQRLVGYGDAGKLHP